MLLYNWAQLLVLVLAPSQCPPLHFASICHMLAFRTLLASRGWNDFVSERLVRTSSPRRAVAFACGSTFLDCSVFYMKLLLVELLRLRRFKDNQVRIQEKLNNCFCSSWWTRLVSVILQFSF